MSKYLKNREPLTEQEVFEYLNTEVEKTERRWGKDNIYSKWAREFRDKKMMQFQAGDVVAVYFEEYSDSYGNGTGDFKDTLYSDGHVETACYGYTD